jgi:ribonuclease HI
VVEDTTILVYTDGAARGNPGPSSAGFAVFDGSGRVLDKGAVFLGEHTNNEAEYEALLLGLEKARSFTRDKVKFHSDSELMVLQVNGVYQVKKDQLKRYVARVNELADGFHNFKIVYVSRENPKIQLVDALANLALDEQGF